MGGTGEWRVGGGEEEGGVENGEEGREEGVESGGEGREGVGV